VAVAFLVTLLMLAPASGDAIAIGTSRDNTLYEDETGSRSNGAGPAMFAGRNSQSTDSIRRAVLAFDVASAIPAGSTVESVTLTLSNSAANVDDEMIRLHRLLADWGEGSSTASGGGGSGGPAAPGDATWLHSFYDTEFWATAGGDFASSVSGSAVVGGPGTYTWASTPQLVADVQRFLDDPASSFGWVLLGNETAPSTAKRFATREEADPALRPVLTVSYTPVPEPGMLTLLLVWVSSAVTRRHGV
jgi:hypothetical protein